MIVDPPWTVLPLVAFFDGGSDDRGVVDAAVVVEALVLDRDRRVLAVLREALPGDRRADLVGLDVAEQLTVRGVDGRGQTAVDRLAQRRRAVGDRDDVSDRREAGDQAQT